jgi:hypothetical protein
MPSYLDFNTTKSFRDFLIGKTLNQPNGPQTFTSTNYSVQNTNNYPNIYQGTVEDIRPFELTQTQNANTYKPTTYFINDTLRILPRKANLALYPYFVSKNHNLIGIMTSGDDKTESELYRFAAHYIKTDSNGPVLARLTQNLEAATIGRFRLADALNGNTATALNLLTGREPLIEPNYKVTVSKTLAGQAVDFIQTVAGTQLPFSTIPGDYLTDPRNPIKYRPTPSTQLGSIIQDVTGAIGSLIGIQRRPKTTRKPSDLLIEHTSNGQLNRLYDLLSYSKYAPNYTTTARSQNSSKLFGFVDKIGQGIKNVLGTEAPAGKAYIGDDRADNVINAMTDQFQRPVHSTYYLGLKFDPVQTDYFEGMKGLGEGGDIASKLTWYGINSKKNNILGANNPNYKTSQESKLLPTLSTNTTFREGSILGVTQDLLNTMPPGGQSRTHVGNVIDQTSRVFKEGNKMLSKGSAIKYTEKFTGIESGVEYCRVWTKDRPYYTYADTMKRTANIRKMDGSVMGGTSRVWNLNYGPITTNNKDFKGSTNLFSRTKDEGNNETFYAKKYMFSIENLAWKTSNKPGFTVQDLPVCERGNNGGRVMWFPPYDLKVTESNSARWESNTFLGRPEPIYTYQNTERSGTISFKVVVDHPSILNLLVNKVLEGYNEEEADNYINAFFAGCKDLDLYQLVQQYKMLSTSDLEIIKLYLNEKPDPDVTKENITILEPIVEPEPNVNPNPNPTKVPPLLVHLRFQNDYPKIQGSETECKINYKNFYDDIINDTFKTNTRNQLIKGITEIYKKNPSKQEKNDIDVLQLTYADGLSGWTASTTSLLEKVFIESQSSYEQFKQRMSDLKNDLTSGLTGNVRIGITSSCSAVADNTYNMALSVRRTDSIIHEVLSLISTGTQDSRLNIKKTDLPAKGDTDKMKEVVYTFKDLGYTLNPDKTLTITTHSKGETAESDFSGDCGKKSFNNMDLKVATHVAFGCRQSIVNIEAYDRNDPGTNNPNGNKPTPGDIKYKTVIIPGGKKTKVEKRKVPIDMMKKIISKTLSECFYFKKLEETDPLVFSSLKEKLKYFHPGFHSMTPEGLNSRLTFLHQCIRPGDTIPIKGISDDKDLNARNTTFGPPPICVIRIGDFYHSKIVIESVGITYDDNVWDLNPEGIGIQPMIAGVNLQVKFIGGQGLEKPVERLQNALSSNFYANTEMYDERSQITNTQMNGMSTEKFTKEFLEGITDNNKKKETTPNTIAPNNEIKTGQFIGNLLVLMDDFGDLLDGDTALFNNTEKYYTNYKVLYNSLLKNYGPKVIGVLLSPNYRTINTYEVATPTSTTNINLFGNYGDGIDSNTLINNFGDSCLKTLNNMTDLSSLFDFSSSAFKNKVGLIAASNDILKKYLPTIINSKIKNDLIADTGSSSFEELRNNLIKSLDKVNFLVKYHYDAKIDEKDSKSGKKITLDGFLIDDFYNQYSNVIEYIKNTNSLLYDQLDDSINFNSPVISESDLKSILQVLLVNEKDNILNLYKTQPTTFPTKVIDDIEGNLKDFLKNQPKLVKFKFKNFPKRTNSKKLSYKIITTDPVTDQNMLSDLIKLNSSSNVEQNKLNYYRKK